MFFRLRCHFCGAKTPHNKSTREFQCNSCEAVNFFDGKGNVVDTPMSVAAPPQTHYAPAKPFLTYTHPIPEALEHQEKQAFCRTCVQNQHLYNENLANYLPDDDHPRYAEFEAAIPKYKADLEKRYPLICKKCAPKAQSTINRADYYGMAQNARRLIQDTRRRGGRAAIGTRDDAGKKMARYVLNCIGLVLYAGLAVQIAYHIYGILVVLFAQDDDEIDDSLIASSPADCAVLARSMRFSLSCFELFNTIIPQTLYLAVAGLVYNPGRKYWYDPTHRMEAVNGQWNYFYIQLIIIAARCFAWLNLSNPRATSQFDWEQLVAMHGFTIFFILISQTIANRGIVPVQWKMKGKIMPKPAEIDVLGPVAAPASEHHTPRASEKDPYRYLHFSEDTPLDINKFAPKSARRTDQQPYTRGSYLTLQQPSPEYSEDDADDDYDRMETDDAPVMRSSTRQRVPQPRSPPVLRPTHGQQPAQPSSSTFTTARPQNPFYTRLPPAPMSMEHRLRNPPLRPVEPVAVPLSQHKDFLKRMGENVRPVDFSSKRTEFELKPSGWVLPGDVKETGLEDRFQATFRLDEAEVPGGGEKRTGWLGMLGL